MKSSDLFFSTSALICMTALTNTALANNKAGTCKDMSNLNPTTNQTTDVQPLISPTPPAMVEMKHEAMPFLSVDYLYWTVRQDNMSFAFPIDGLNNTLIRNKLNYPKWKWDSGFRVGAGINFKHDGWDTYFNYTRFYPENAKRHVAIHGTQVGLVPTWPYFTESGFLTESTQTWKFEFNNLDWELGRSFFISRFLTLRPFAGLKTAWQTQRQKIITLQPGTPTIEYQLRNIQDFWGLGIRIGADSTWYVYKKNLSVIADIALSALWSNYSNRQTQRNINLSTNVNNLFYNIFDHHHAIRPVLEADLGMQWESWFYENKMRFSFKAAWEEQVWWNQNNLGAFLTTSSGGTFTGRGGDLFLQGLTLRARFDF